MGVGNRSGFRVFFFFFSLIFITGCTSKETSLSTAQRKPLSEHRVVNLAIWSNYLSPSLVTEFEKTSGIHLQVSNYSSNEELLAKLQAGAAEYDVVVPSDYMVYAMSKLGLIQELDYAQLPNSKNLDPKYLKKTYDPGNKYAVPYDWGTTGIAINRSLYKGQIKSWKDLFEKPDLAGKFSLLDDVREVLGAALKAQGASMNSRDPKELNKAKELLLKARGRVKEFSSEPLMSLINGETAVAHIYMSDALQARKATGGKIDYIIPEEGGTFWIDNLVVPKAAPHPKEAYALINFLLDAKSVVSTTVSVFVAPANKDAIALLPKELQMSTMLFPPTSVLSRCEMLEDLGDSVGAWDRIWTEVKAQHD